MRHIFLKRNKKDFFFNGNHKMLKLVLFDEFIDDVRRVGVYIEFTEIHGL